MLMLGFKMILQIFKSIQSRLNLYNFMLFLRHLHTYSIRLFITYLSLNVGQQFIGFIGFYTFFLEMRTKRLVIKISPHFSTVTLHHNKFIYLSTSITKQYHHNIISITTLLQLLLHSHPLIRSDTHYHQQFDQPPTEQRVFNFPSRIELTQIIFFLFCLQFDVFLGCIQDGISLFPESYDFFLFDEITYFRYLVLIHYKMSICLILNQYLSLISLSSID